MMRSSVSEVLPNGFYERQACILALHNNIKQDYCNVLLTCKKSFCFSCGVSMQEL